jgi:hypothetical protein
VRNIAYFFYLLIPAMAILGEGAAACIALVAAFHIHGYAIDEENRLAVAVGNADPLAAFEAWMRRRGPLGAGAVPERIFFAGFSAGERAATPVRGLGQVSTEQILRLVCEHTGKRINLDNEQLDQYIAFARAAIAVAQSTGVSK